MDISSVKKIPKTRTTQNSKSKPKFTHIDSGLKVSNTHDPNDLANINQVDMLDDRLYCTQFNEDLLSLNINEADDDMLLDANFHTGPNNQHNVIILQLLQTKNVCVGK